MVNEDDVRALLIKKSRRDLLTTLKMFYPAEVDFETLRLTLPTVEDQHLRTDLSYLIDKGYATWTNEQANMPWKTREFRLTASGVETADRINRDAALEP